MIAKTPAPQSRTRVHTRARYLTSCTRMHPRTASTNLRTKPLIRDTKWALTLRFPWFPSLSHAPHELHRAAHAAVRGPQRANHAVVANLPAQRHLKAVVVLLDPRDAPTAEPLRVRRPAAPHEGVRTVDAVVAPATDGAVLVKCQVRGDTWSPSSSSAEAPTYSPERGV